MAISGDRKLYAARRDSAYRTLYEANAPTLRLDERFAFHDTVVEKIGAETELLYLEFGVARGTSLGRFATQFTHPRTRLVGFDSFVGLPEAWSKFEVGHFSLKGRFPKIDDARVEFVKGWFQNSVPGFLKNLEIAPETTILVHYDADLYSSTLFLLTALWWRIPDYYFIMDEFYGEELIALQDFKDAYPIDIEYMSVMEGRHSDRLGRRTPHKLFGRIRNVEMTVEEPRPAAV